MAGLAVAGVLLAGCAAPLPTAPSRLGPLSTVLPLEVSLAPDYLMSRDESGCGGWSERQHVWRYALTVTNHGTTPFVARRLIVLVVGSYSATEVRTHDSGALGALFGTGAIQPGRAVTAAMCLDGQTQFGALTHTFEGEDGSAFVSAAVQLNPGFAPPLPRL